MFSPYFKRNKVGLSTVEYFKAKPSKNQTIVMYFLQDIYKE